MSLLLRLKPWLLFTLTFGLPMLIALFGNVGLFMTPHSMPIFLTCFAVSTAFLAFGLFSWLWAMGTRLPLLLPDNAALSSKILKASLLVPAVYIVSILIVLTGVFSSSTDNPAFAFLLLLPLHLLSMAGIFYSLYFVAKALKSVELQRVAVFSDYLTDFFLLWFYPVGIWVIQPRVNRLFGPNNVA